MLERADTSEAVNLSRRAPSPYSTAGLAEDPAAPLPPSHATHHAARLTGHAPPAARPENSPLEPTPTIESTCIYHHPHPPSPSGYSHLRMNSRSHCSQSKLYATRGFPHALA